MKLEDVTEGKIKVGNTTYNMVEAKYGGVVVWPAGQPSVTTYVIVASWYNYSNSGGDILLASGQNYATAWGNVEVRENGVPVNTLYNQRLGIALSSSAPQYFSVSNNQIYGAYLGTTYNGNNDDNTTNPILSYNGGSNIIGPAIYQEINQVVSTSTTQGTPVYDYSQEYDEYTYYFSLGANRYTSTSSKCPAYGGTATLSLTSYHYKESWIPYTRTDTVTRTYTSTATDTTYPVVSDVAHSVVREDDTATITGSAIGFTRSNMGVTIASYNTTASGWDTGRSVTYTASITKYDGTTMTDTVTIYQDPDSISSTTYPTVREWTSQPSTAYSDYTATITIADYSTTSHVAPASESYVGFGVSGSHRELTTRNYVDVTTPTYTWVSGRQTTGTPTTETGTATISDTTVTTDVPTLAYTYETGHGSDWLTYQSANSRLKIDSEGTTTYTNAQTYGRRGKITATNGSATDEVYVYQARNTSTLEYGYNLAISIDGNDTIPATQEMIGVTYTCQERTRYTYTSGASTSWSSYTYATPTITTTPSGFTVSDLTYNHFVVNFGSAYTGQTSRTITVQITTRTATPVSDSVTQEAYVPVVQKVAEFKPYIFDYNAGVYVKGHVYYTLGIVSGSAWQSTLTGVVLHWKVNNGTEQTLNLGNVAVEETTIDPGTLVPSTGVTIPTFSSGTIKAWFSVTGTGDFDTIRADENNYYYQITL